MLIIRCTWCGDRAEIEFSYGGEADITRPISPETIDDEAWGDYLFMRKNPKGVAREQWNHAFGCRKWFLAERDNVSYRFVQAAPREAAS